MLRRGGGAANIRHILWGRYGSWSGRWKLRRHLMLRGRNRISIVQASSIIQDLGQLHCFIVRGGKFEENNSGCKTIMAEN